MASALNRFQTDTNILDAFPYDGAINDEHIDFVFDSGRHRAIARDIIISFQTPGVNLGTHGFRIASTTEYYGAIYVEPIGLGSVFGYTSFLPMGPIVGGFRMNSGALDNLASVGLGALGMGMDSHASHGVTWSIPERPTLNKPDHDELRFQTLKEKWRKERGISSSTIDIVTCESYQKIIGMGQKALPYIFAQMRQEGNKPDQWFWALRMITQENPVPREVWGNRKEMAKHWLEWADRNGFIER